MLPQLSRFLLSGVPRHSLKLVPYWFKQHWTAWGPCCGRTAVGRTHPTGVGNGGRRSCSVESPTEWALGGCIFPITGTFAHSVRCSGSPSDRRSSRLDVALRADASF